MPVINLLSKPALLGFIYRMLAGDSDPAQSPLTLRKIEHLKMNHTELLKHISSLKMDVEITKTKELRAKHDASQAALDLQIFEQQAPPEPKKKGLFGPKLTKEQKEAREQRGILMEDASRLGDEAQYQTHKLNEQQMDLKESDEDLKKTIDSLEHLYQEYSGQLAARVLALVSQDQADEARHLVNETRQIVRGNLMVAVLLVLIELFSEDQQEALAQLGSLRTIFSQHKDPMADVVASLIALTRGRKLRSQDLGMTKMDSFSQPSFGRFSELLRALSGWKYDEEGLKDDPALPSLWVIKDYIWFSEKFEEHQPQEPSVISRWVVAHDLVLRTIAVSQLVIRGEYNEAAISTGLDFSRIEEPKRRNQAWSGLMDSLSGDVPAFPSALVETWRQTMACYLLIAARQAGPEGLYQQWLEESYNWDKTNFYWWTLAMLKEDRNLLANLKDETDPLVPVSSV